jgi:hypothetical protein
MSIEDLLKPRYKVIADYPNATFKVGSVWGELDIAMFSMTTDETKPDKYPHLFKKLEWWEERSEVEIPYLKTPAGNSVRKVESIDLMWGRVTFVGGKVRKIKQWLPATEKEYEEYLQSKQTKP